MFEEIQRWADIHASFVGYKLVLFGLPAFLYLGLSCLSNMILGWTWRKDRVTWMFFGFGMLLSYVPTLSFFSVKDLAR